MKRTFAVLIFIIAIAVLFILVFGLPEYQITRENNERIRIRKEDIARHNPELLARIEEAIEILEQKLKEDPNDSKNWFELGTNKYQLGDYIGAEEALKKAVKLDSISINALHNLGVLYQDREEYQKAEEAFKEIVSRHPDLPDGYIRLAELYRPGTYKDRAEEEKVLLSGLQVMEKNTTLLLTLAEYYDRNKLYNQALTTYRKLLALNPPNKTIIEGEIARLENLQ